MHEFGITSRIVDAVVKVAEEHEGARVLQVDLLVGALTFLSARQVKAAYEVLTRGTLLEGSELVVQEGPAVVECTACGHRQEVSINLADGPESLSEPLPLFSCSECGGKVDVVNGKECQVTGVTLEE